MASELARRAYLLEVPQGAVIPLSCTYIQAYILVLSGNRALPMGILKRFPRSVIRGSFLKEVGGMKCLVNLIRLCGLGANWSS